MGKKDVELARQENGNLGKTLRADNGKESGKGTEKMGNEQRRNRKNTVIKAAGTVAETDIHVGISNKT